MGREKESYYDWLTMLQERYGADAVFITMQQAAQFCRKDRRTLFADKTFPVKKLGRIYNVPIVQFARWLASA